MVSMMDQGFISTKASGPTTADYGVNVKIFENLSWNKQIEIVAKKLSRTNGILSKLRYYVSKNTLNSIYYKLYSLVLHVAKN